MTDDRDRPSLLGGFWAALIGAALYTVLLVSLNPITRQQDCPNWGAAGNASAFGDESWDLYLPLICVGWLLLVAGEQVFPIAWRHRSGAVVTIRAACALLATVTFACCSTTPPLIVCH